MSERMTYLNPVHPRPCPDPYVLKYLNEYWCYCTGFWHDGRCFGVLHSRDLINWRELGGAMERYDPQATCWWAPEVVYDNGIFRMYYSVGIEVKMQIRVAEAAHPAGPFKDCGVGLTKEEFAIDAHVFEDEEGARWLFYATDFLTHTHIGTGTVCDRMIDPYTLAGEARPVTRARYDWQVYDPHRIEKGGVRWHTVEGPFVLKRKGSYYQMFSGGNWQNETYGASYATSQTIVRPDEWEQHADGNQVLPILRTIPGKVIGPGHNSVVRGPDNRQMYCIYHEWSSAVNDRVLAIDRLDWAGNRMLVTGPSSTPQFAPIAPTISDSFDQATESGLGRDWSCSGGRWFVRDGLAWQQQVAGTAEALCSANMPYFTAEVSLKLIDEQSNGAAGIKLYGNREPVLSFAIKPEDNQAVIALQNEAKEDQFISLPSEFKRTAFHLLRIEVNGRCVKLSIDGTANKWEGRLAQQADALALFTENRQAAFAGFALTSGWEDLFTETYAELNTLGWLSQQNICWQLNGSQLWHCDKDAGHSVIVKGPLPEEYELVVNAKLVENAGTDACYGIIPMMAGNEPEDDLLFTVRQSQAGWSLCYRDQSAENAIPLSVNFDPFNDQQFRFWRQHGQLHVFHEAQPLVKIAVQSAASNLGLYVNRAVVAFDMVRVTAIEG